MLGYCYTRNYETKYGMIKNHKIPHDHNNEFEQHLIPPYEEIKQWHKRPLKKRYSVIYIDASNIEQCKATLDEFALNGMNLINV